MVKKIKLDEIKNRYDVVNDIINFANRNPITSESIIEYMHYWDKELEHFKVDICEFVQICCFLKCYSQVDNDKICSATHRMYRIAGYNSPVGIMHMVYDKCLIIRNSEQSEERIAIEISTVFQNFFGIRCAWIGTAIENEYGNWNKYRVIDENFTRKELLNYCEHIDNYNQLLAENQRLKSNNDYLVKEISKLARESIKREKALAKLEAEVMKKINEYDSNQMTLDECLMGGD